MENKVIDILVPVYNGESYIARCLNSLMEQTYKNLRIVIADDGSTDKTAEIIKSYMEKYSNIEYFYKENEKSISKTRNFLLSKIKSTLFTFFDSDDYAEPNYIEELYNIMISTNADISLCGKSRHNENKHVDLSKQNKDSKLIFMNRNECIAEMLSSNLFNGTVYCKLFRTSILGDADFDENIHYGEDLDFCFKIMLNANSFVLSTKKLYHYLIRKNSIVTSKFKTTKLTCLDCYDKIIEQVKDISSELYICAKSMQGLIAIELLYYTWRDHYKDKALKRRLKKMIKESIPFIWENKRLSKLLQKTPYVWWLTKIM